MAGTGGAFDDATASGAVFSAGGFIQPTVQLAIIWLACGDQPSSGARVAVRLPSQGTGDANTNCDQVAAKPSRTSPFHSVFYCYETIINCVAL
jgi:hypothetical protein